MLTPTVTTRREGLLRRNAGLSSPVRLGCLSLLCGLAVFGCKADPTSLTILQMQPVDDSCEVSPDISQPLTRGVVDVALASNYVSFALVRNSMANVVTAMGFRPSDGRVQSHHVLLREAVVEYTTLDPISAQLPQRRILPLSGTIETQTDVPIGIELLDAGMIQAIRQSPEFLVIDSQDQARPVRTQVTLVAKVTFIGTVLDGSVVESNALRFPIQICNGCRITYPPEAIDDTAGRTPNCLALTQDEDREPLECPSFVGTDSKFIDCIDCQGFAVDSLARQLCQPPAGL